MSVGTGQPKHSIICQANSEGESHAGSRQRAQGDGIEKAQHYFAAAIGIKRLHEAPLLPICEVGQSHFPTSQGTGCDNKHIKTSS